MSHNLRKRLADDSGSAILEFLIIGLAANIALLSFATDVLQVQKHQLAAESIARHAARDYSTLQDAGSARLVATQVADGFALSPSDWQISAECEPVDCLEPNAVVNIQVVVDSARASAIMPVLLDSAINLEPDLGTESSPDE